MRNNNYGTIKIFFNKQTCTTNYCAKINKINKKRVVYQKIFWMICLEKMCFYFFFFALTFLQIILDYNAIAIL